MPAEATGLSAKVAKPQSGVSSTRSSPKSSIARANPQPDLLDRLDGVELLVHNADADTLVLGQVA